jgi:hypothetical protein
LAKRFEAGGQSGMQEPLFEQVVVDVGADERDQFSGEAPEPEDEKLKDHVLPRGDSRLRLPLQNLW